MVWGEEKQERERALRKEKGKHGVEEVSKNMKQIREEKRNRELEGHIGEREENQAKGGGEEFAVKTELENKVGGKEKKQGEKRNEKRKGKRLLT